MWGARPSRSRTRSAAVREAIARSRALSKLRRRGALVHALPPAVHRPGARARLAGSLYSGAIVELRPGTTERAVDVVARDAGVSGRVGAFRASTAGGLVTEVRTASGERAILRAAGAGWPGDPAAAADALTLLASAGAPAPRLLGRGVIAGASWTLETFCTGTRPRRLDPTMATTLASIAARLPQREGRAGAQARDLDRVAAALPHLADRIGSVRALMGSVDAPAILRHGDLWLGNVLAGAGGVFIVDWEGWAPDGFPGADLLHLIATERRIDARTDMGAVWRANPWRDADFRRIAAPYWRAIGWQPSDEEGERIGIAWWAAEIAGTLARVPERADDARWVAVNVENVLADSS